MSQIHDGPLATYCSLTDKNLAGYFSNTKMRRHLKKAGLVDRRGQIISENQYRLNMARKEHKKHVKDLLAQAIVHKTLDIERNRQVEIKRKLEEIAKLEVVRRVRADTKRRSDSTLMPLLTPRLRPPSSAPESVQEEENVLTPGSLATKFRKGDEDILPYLSPRSSRPQSRSGRYRPQSAPADRQYNDSYDADVIYVDDEGRPVTPPKDIQEDHKREEIDTRHLYALDSAALKKYALTLSKIEQGEGMTSPYLISQVPSPPRSARGSARNNYRDARYKSRLQRPRTANSLSPYRSTRTGAVQFKETDKCKDVYQKPVSNKLVELEFRDKWQLADKKAHKSSSVHGTLMLHRQEPAMMHQGEVQTLCEVTMKYYGPNLILPRDQRDPTQDVEIEQQHCGGNTLPVFKERIKPGDEFTFISRRHRGYPFSLSIFVDGRISARVSTCCEYGHAKGVRLGGKMGQFCLKNITGATPCYKCKLNAQASPRTLKRPTSKRRQQKVEQIKEEIIVIRPERKEKEEEEAEDNVEVPVEGARDDDDDDKTRSHKAYIKTDTDSVRSDNKINENKTQNEDNYDDDFEDEESGSKKDSGTDARINILDKDDTNENDLDIRGQRCEEDDEDDWSYIEDAKVIPPRKDLQMRSSTPVVGWDEEKEEAIISREENDDDETDGKRHVHFDEDVQCIAASDESEDTLGQKESDNAKDRDLKKEREIETKVEEFLEDNDTCDEVSEIETDLDSPRRKQESQGRVKKPSREDEKGGVTREDKLKRLQKQDNEVYSDDFDSVTSYVSESSTKSTEVIKGESTETFSSESSTPKTGEYKEHKNKAPVDVVSPMHMHVKVHKDDLPEINKVKEEKTVLVEEKEHNFEIRRESDEEEDSSMEFRKGGPMSITFSEMDIIGPLATLLVKVRRRRREKTEKRSRKQMLIMIDESETDSSDKPVDHIPVDSTSKASNKQADHSSVESVDTTSKASDKPVNDSSVDTVSKASNKQVDHTPADATSTSVKEGSTDAVQNEKKESETEVKDQIIENNDSKSETETDSKAENSEKIICQGRLKPISKTKSRTTKKSQRSEHSDSSLSSISSLSGSSNGTRKTGRRDKAIVVKPAQATKETSMSEVEVETVTKQKIKPKKELISDHFDANIVTTPTVSYSKETVLPQQNSNVRFVKPSYLQREYDDDDGYDKVRMKKAEQRDKKKDPTDEDILRQLIQSTFDESYEVDDEMSVIDIDDDEPSISEKFSTTDKLSESFAQTVHLKKDNVNDDTNNSSKMLTAKLKATKQSELDNAPNLEIIGTKSNLYTELTDEIEEIRLDDDKNEPENQTNKISTTDKKTNDEQSITKDQKEETNTSMDHEVKLVAEKSYSIKFKADSIEEINLEEDKTGSQKDENSVSQKNEKIATIDQTIHITADRPITVKLEAEVFKASQGRSEIPQVMVASADFFDEKLIDEKQNVYLEKIQSVQKTEVPIERITPGDGRNVTFIEVSVADPEDAEQPETDVKPEQNEVTEIDMLDGNDSVSQELWTVPRPIKYITMLEEREKSIDDSNIPVASSYKTLLEGDAYIENENKTEPKETVLNDPKNVTVKNSESESQIVIQDAEENMVDLDHKEIGEETNMKQFIYQKYSVENQAETIVMESVTSKPVNSTSSVPLEEDNLSISSAIVGEYVQTIIAEAKKIEEAQTVMNDHVQNIMSEAKKLEEIQVKSSVNDEIKSEDINERKKEEIQVKSSVNNEMESDGFNEMKKEKLEEIVIKSSTPDEMKSDEISERKKDEVMKTNENKATVTLDEIKDDSSKDIAMMVVDEVKVDETDRMSTTSETNICSVSSSVIESYVDHVLATATEQTVTNIAVSKQEDKEDKVIPLTVDIKPDVLLQETVSVKDASGETMPATKIKVPESKPKTSVVKEQNEISTAVSSSETSPNSNPTTVYNKDTIAQQKSVSEAATDEHLRCKVEQQQSVTESTIRPNSESDGPSNTDPSVKIQENNDSTADTVSLTSVLSSVVLEYVGNVLDTVKKELTTDQKVEVNQLPDMLKDSQSLSLTQNDMQRTSVVQSEIKSQVEDGKTQEVDQSNKEKQNDVKELVIQSEMKSQVEDGMTQEGDQSNKDKHDDVEESSVSSSVVMEYVHCIVHTMQEDLSKINNKDEKGCPKEEQEVGNNEAEKEAVVPETPRTDPEGQESDEKPDTSRNVDISNTNNTDTAVSAPESLVNISRAAIQKNSHSNEQNYNSDTKESTSDISTEQNEKKENPETIVVEAEIHTKQDTAKACENVKVSEKNTKQTSDVFSVGKELIPSVSDKNSESIANETVISDNENKHSEETEPENESKKILKKEKSQVTEDEQTEGTEPEIECTKILKTEKSQVTSKQIDKKVLPDKEMITEAVNEHIYSDDSDEMRAVEVAVLETGMVGSLAAIIHLDSSSNESISGATLTADNKNVSNISGVNKEENQMKPVEENHEDIDEGKAVEACISERKAVSNTENSSSKSLDTTITETKPEDKPSIESKSIDTPIAETKPVHTSIIETKSEESPTTETKSIDTQITETKSEDTPITETKPVDTSITETKHIDTPTTENKPVDVPTSETKPVDTPITEKKSEESPTTETKPVDVLITETKPVERPTTETKSEDKSTTETESVDTPLTETKPLDIPITKTKPVDVPTTETKPLDTSTTETKPVDTPIIETEPKDVPTIETKSVNSPTTETKPADTLTTETKKVDAQITETKPVETLTTETKSENTSTTENKPADTLTTGTKPVDTQITETKPVETLTTETKSENTSTTENKPADTLTTGTKPVDTQITETKPVETLTTETKSEESPITETKPVDAQITETQPVETLTTETKSENTSTTENKPADTLTTGTKPVDTQITETKPVETLTTETKSEESPITETKPVEVPTTETKQVDTPITETKVVDTPTTETKPLDTQIIETKSLDKPTTETKPVDTPITETKSVDKTTAETILVDPSTTENKPADTLTTGTKPVDTQITETKPVETLTTEIKSKESPITETKPVEVPTTETKQVDTPITETKVVDTPTTETKPLDTQIIETKSVDKPTTETKSVDTPITETKSVDKTTAETILVDPPTTEIKPVDTPITETKSVDIPTTETKQVNKQITETKSVEKTTTETKLVDSPTTETKPVDTPNTETKSVDKPIFGTKPDNAPTTETQLADKQTTTTKPEAAENTEIKLVAITGSNTQIIEPKPAETPVTETNSVDSGNINSMILDAGKRRIVVVPDIPAKIEPVSEQETTASTGNIVDSVVIEVGKIGITAVPEVSANVDPNLENETSASSSGHISSVIVDVGKIGIVAVPDVPDIKEQVSEQENSTHIIDSVVVDAGKVGIITVPVATENAEPAQEQESSSQTGSSVEAALTEAGKVIGSVVHLNADDISEAVVNEVASSNEKTVLSVIENIVISSEKIAAGVVHIDEINKDVQNTKDKGESIDVTVDLSQTGVTFRENETVQPVQCSTPKTQQNNPFETKTDTGIQNDKAEQVSTISSGNWTVDIMEDNGGQEVNPDLKREIPEVPNIVVTSPNNPPNEDCVVQISDQKQVKTKTSENTQTTSKQFDLQDLPISVAKEEQTEITDNQPQQPNQTQEKDVESEGKMLTETSESDVKREKSGSDIENSEQNDKISIETKENLEIKNAASDELEIKKASSNGLEIKDAVSNGLEIKDALPNELEIKVAVSNELEIKDAASNGLEIKDAASNGLEIKDAASHGLKSFEDEEVSAILNEIDDNLNSGEKKKLTEALKENFQCNDQQKEEMNILTKKDIEALLESDAELMIDKQTLKEIKSAAYDVDVMSTISEVTTDSVTQSVPK